MAASWLYRSCCQAHSDIIHPASHARTQRHLHSHELAGSIPPYPFGLNDFYTAALPNLNDSYRSCTMGLTQGRCECSQRTEHLPGTTPFNRSVCYTSITTNFSNLCQSVPSQRKLHSTLPPFLASRGDQTLSLKMHFEEYAYGRPPDVVRFRDTAHRQSFSTDATPFDRLAPHGTRNMEDVASSTLRSNGQKIQHAAYSHLPYNTEHLPVFDPSYVPIGSGVFSTSDIYQWPSSIAAASNISATRCSAPQVTNYDRVGHLGTLTSLQCPYNNSEFNDINPTTIPSVLRPRRRRVEQRPCLSDVGDFNPPTVPSVSHPRRRLLKQEACLSDADSSDPSISHLLSPMEPDPSDINSSDFSNTCLLVPKEPPLDDVDYSKTATPCHPVRNKPRLEEEPNFSKSSTENEADPDYVFKKYTYQEDSSSDECQVSGFGAPKAPNVSLQHIPKTLEPCAAEDIKMQPIGDAGFEERFQPQKMDCQQAIPNILSAASEPPKEKKPKKEKEKKPRIKKKKGQKTKANPDRIRKNYSSRRRHNPNFLYWCADPTCKTSQDRGFRGFRTTEDTRRHLAMHEPPTMLCKLAHKDGDRYEGRRTDHLRE